MSVESKGKIAYLSWIIVATIAVGFYWIFSLEDEQQSPSPAIAQMKLAVEAQFMSDQEPTALAAGWTASNTFTIVVEDDGSSRNGYAQYACEIVREIGLKSGYTVEITDRASALGEAEKRTLGQSNC